MYDNKIFNYIGLYIYIAEKSKNDKLYFLL